MLFTQLPPERRRVIIAANPKAGARPGRPAVERLELLLSDSGYDVEILSDIGEIAAAAGEAHQAGRLRAVVAAGGDGTAALIANEIPPGAPISLLPLGTENLLSKNFSLATAPVEAFRVIDRGVATQMDAGRANGRLFLIMLGCGFDADVVQRLHKDRTGHIHHLSYVRPIIDSLWWYDYPELLLTMETEKGEESVHCRWAFVVNLPQYAIGINLVPGAEYADGLLDVCTFRKGSVFSGLNYLAHVMAGQHQSLSDCNLFRVRRMRIESDGVVPFQLDGDPGGTLPAEVEVLPARLTILVPPEWAARKGAVLPAPQLVRATA